MKLRSLSIWTNLEMRLKDLAYTIASLLSVCKHLRILEVESDDLIACIERKLKISIPSLDHLHLHISTNYRIPYANDLSMLFPNISYLSTGHQVCHLDINLANSILHFIKTFPRLRRLRFNDSIYMCPYDMTHLSEDYVVQFLDNSEPIRSRKSLVRCYHGDYDRNRIVIWF